MMETTTKMLDAWKNPDVEEIKLFIKAFVEAKLRARKIGLTDIVLEEPGGISP